MGAILFCELFTLVMLLGARSGLFSSHIGVSHVLCVARFCKYSCFCLLNMPKNILARKLNVGLRIGQANSTNRSGKLACCGVSAQKPRQHNPATPDLMGAKNKKSLKPQPFIRFSVFGVPGALSLLARRWRSGRRKIETRVDSTACITEYIHIDGVRRRDTTYSHAPRLPHATCLWHTTRTSQSLQESPPNATNIA